METTVSLIKMLAGLALVLATIIFLYYLAGRLRMIKGLKEGPIRLVALKTLTPKSHLALVEVAGRRLLLGVGEGGVRLIKDLGSEDFSRALAAAEERDEG
ncbi:FliO/MopB family protein [Thermosulfuriphilus sp.]